MRKKVPPAAEQAMPVTAEQEPPRGEGGVPLPGAKRREKGEGAKRLRGMSHVLHSRWRPTKSPQLHACFLRQLQSQGRRR